MLRSAHPGIVLGALAVLSFGVGVGLEPMFETSAHATIPAPGSKLLQPAVKPAKADPSAAIASPAAQSIAATEPAETPPDVAPQAEAEASETPQPTIEEGMDAEKNVGFIEMKNLPEQQGEGSLTPGRDVDMIDAAESSANAVPVPDATTGAGGQAAPN